MTPMLHALHYQPWLITPEAHAAMLSALSRTELFRDDTPQPPEPELLSVESGVGVVTIHGALMKRPGFFERLFLDATDMEAVSEALEAARKHLEESSHARAHAESAVAALDRREAELSEQNKLFNAALSNMPQGLCMFDANQDLLVCNDRYVEMGLKTLSEHFAEQGMDFAEEMEIRAQNARALLDLAEKYRVPIDMLWKPSGGIEATPAVGEPEDPPTLTGVRQPG